MAIYEATIQHDDKTFEDLAHMQYDLFCKSNRLGRTILSLVSVLLGIAYSESWWGILVIGYGCYLTTSTYSSSNHTAHKLAKQIRAAGMDFPSSRYEFTEEGMQVITLPENKPLGDIMPYGEFRKLGEDRGRAAASDLVCKRLCGEPAEDVIGQVIDGNFGALVRGRSE